MWKNKWVNSQALLNDANAVSVLWLNKEDIDKVVNEINTKVRDIVDYTKEEIEKIDSLMQEVYKIDDMIKNWKRIYASIDYWKFMLIYKNLSDRVKRYFEAIYVNFLLVWANEKIQHILLNPLKSWIDKKALLSHISNILEYIPDYDFSSYQNEELNNLVQEIREKK